jgi:hypothetical protein
MAMGHDNSIAELVKRINEAIGDKCPDLKVTRQSIRDYCHNGTIKATRHASRNPLSSKFYWMIPEPEATRVVTLFIDRCK